MMLQYVARRKVTVKKGSLLRRVTRSEDWFPRYQNSLQLLYLRVLGAHGHYDNDYGLEPSRNVLDALALVVPGVIVIGIVVNKLLIYTIIGKYSVILIS